ncbi:oligosaccharide flippase family protein [bacterium]|nr:oligosaccharide flippase family protein [bacterium]
MSMLFNIKRLTKHTTVYGLGHILSRFLGFLLLPIHTNVLPPELYRTAALLFSSLAILNIIFTFGMDIAFLRFFILEDSRERKRRIFSTVYWMIIGTGICFSTFMILNPEPLSRLIFHGAIYKTIIRLAAGILLTDALCLIPFLVLRGEEKSKRFVFLKFLNISVNIALNILFVVIMKKGIEGIFLSNLFASLFTLITLMPILIEWFRFNFNISIFKELFRFGIPYVPSGLSIIIMDQIGRFFLDRMEGKEVTGIFSASYKLGMLMALVVAAFRFAWHPFFLKIYTEGNAKKIYARVLTYFLGVTGFVFLFVSYFIEDIIRFRIRGIGLFGEGYEKGISIVPIVMLAYIGYGVYVNFIVGIYLKKKTAILPVVTFIGALVSIAGNFLLIPEMKIEGAAWATFLAYTSMAAALYFLSHKLFPIPYEFGRILKLIFVVAVLYFSGMNITGVIRPWIRFGLLFTIFPFLWLLRFYYEDEKLAFKNLLRNKIVTGKK